MARRKRFERREERGRPRFGLNPETKRGIFVVLFIVLSILLFLSYFNLAGLAGEAFDQYVAVVFGWDRWLLPFVFFILGTSLIFERVRFSTFNAFGLLFFFLSFNALFNLLVFGVTAAPENVASGAAGGYLGLLLHRILTSLIGFWGALVTLVAFLVISLLLLFNTSLRSIFFIHTRLGRLKEDWRRSKGQETEEPKELEELEREEESEETEEPKESGGEEFRQKSLTSAPVEQMLTSRYQRKIEIPFNILEYRANKASAGDLVRNREVIQKTLEQFGIDVEMGDTAVGPTVTQYTLRPESGVKLARIVALQNDLALALAAHPIRIEAPIPGKALVGIEVPNQTVATVSLRELLESKEFRRREGHMSFPLGKDVAGTPWIARLDKMPHLLIAGATGSGKSVCLHTIITSLLYQNGPDDLKFLFVDPKRVELTVYDGIPHLLIPPIMKVEDTVNALKWAVREMERRLDVLSKFGARDLSIYNLKAEAKIPEIVIVIDELADLMAASRHEVEGLIVRIAQMARAVGIHLVLATQRPSVDVLTGLIKANIPSRIAFAVASQVDSRTILDTVGAEKLVGRGDMLYSSAELSKPKRLQGAYVSEQEIGRIVQFLKRAGEPDYNYRIVERETTGTVFDSSTADEPMLEEAVAAVVEAGRASTSLLQRRLKIGYSRAARIIDRLEEQGIVGPPDGARPREVLVTEWPINGSRGSEIGSQMMDRETVENSDNFEIDPEQEEENKIDDEEVESISEKNSDDWFIDETKRV